MERLFAIVVIALFLCFVSFACGTAFSVFTPGDNPNSLLISILTMLSGWVSGFGTFFAAAIALYIAKRQSAEARAQDAVRCIYHAMAVVNDLRSRVFHLERTLTQGGRPLAALTQNAGTISRRYESLFDRDLYLPGTIVDSITAMSAHFFALDTWVAAQASALDGRLHATLPNYQDLVGKEIAPVRELKDQLDALFTELDLIARRNSRYGAT